MESLLSYEECMSTMPIAIQFFLTKMCELRSTEKQLDKVLVTELIQAINNNIIENELIETLKKSVMISQEKYAITNWTHEMTKEKLISMESTYKQTASFLNIPLDDVGLPGPTPDDVKRADNKHPINTGVINKIKTKYKDKSSKPYSKSKLKSVDDHSYVSSNTNNGSNNQLWRSHTQVSSDDRDIKSSDIAESTSSSISDEDDEENPLSE